MLIMLCVTLTLVTLAVWAIAAATRSAMDRLGVDLMSALLWLGLAERPTRGG